MLSTLRVATAARRAATQATALRSASTWAKVQQGPPDAILGITEAFKADPSDKKINLGVGAYRDDKGKPYVLPSVREAEQKIVASRMNKEYAGITGVPEFTKSAALLAYGKDSSALDRLAITQSVSGTGALRIGGAFLERFFPGAKTIYVPNSTWANHGAIFNDCGLKVEKYRYYNKDTIGLDYEGLIADIEAAPQGSVFLLHACAHNPTGVDPSTQQWEAIEAAISKKGHTAFFDMAYQGFASGDINRDAFAVRHFVAKGHQILLAQSFAKNMGLYGERAGCFHFVTAPAGDAAATATRVASQLAILQRSEISNPPIYGAKIASTVLNNPELFAEWQANLREMSGRIIEMRKALRAQLEQLGTPGTWNHITDQIGMFSFTGLSEAQVLKLRDQYHIYMTKNGRISMAGLNTRNVEYFAKAVDKVVRDTQ